MDSKKCSKCGEIKLIDEFGRLKRSIDGYLNYCKICSRSNDLKFRRTKTGLINKIFYSQVLRSKKRGHNKPSYSKTELIDYLIKNNYFNELYSKWADSNYNMEGTPSLDRLDDYKGYSFDNIRIVTWRENKQKYYNDVKSGKNTKKSIGVNKLSKNGLFIESFYSIKKASRVTGIDNSSITRCCKGKSKTAGGFKWEYAEELIKNGKAVRKV